MSNENSALKKEFDTKTVKRLRNLITKNYNNSTNTQSGYTKEAIEYEENIPFEENGKTWVIKDGIKSNITKLDSFKKLVHIPLLCPKCSHLLKTQYDIKMYNIHKMCLNCVSEYETQLKLDGKYENYKSNIINNNIEFYLNEYGDYLNDIENNIGNDGFVAENGNIEEWLGNNKNSILKLKQQLEEIKKSREEQA